MNQRGSLIQTGYIHISLARRLNSRSERTVAGGPEGATTIRTVDAVRSARLPSQPARDALMATYRQLTGAGVTTRIRDVNPSPTGSHTGISGQRLCGQRLTRRVPKGEASRTRTTDSTAIAAHSRSAASGNRPIRNRTRTSLPLSTTSGCDP